MASFVIQVAPWPVGQTVSVYFAEGWTNVDQAPSGSAITSAAVSAANTVSFDGLPDDRRLVAYALGQGVRFGTSATGLQSVVSTPDRERIKALEDALQGGSAGGSRVLLWDDAAGDYSPAEWLTDTSIPREFVGPTDPSTLGSVTGPVFGDRWTPTEAP